MNRNILFHKLPAALLAVLLSAGLAGCSGNTAATGSSDTSGSSQGTGSPESSSSTASETASAPVETLASASVTYYEKSSLGKEELLEAIKSAQGSCTIATVNADGTPHLTVASPGVADESHIVFGLAPSVVKDNLERTGQAVICYYIHNPAGADKFERNHGARILVELERDPEELAKLGDSDVPTYLKIVAVLPLG